MLFKCNAELKLPASDELVVFHRPGWICFCYYPITIGVTLPFSRLVTNVITSMHVSPGKIMPFVWRILAFLDAIEEKHQLGIDADVVKYSYTLKKFSGCRYSFVNRRKDESLVFNIDNVNDRGSKNEFFFVKRTSFGDVSIDFLGKWNAEDVDLELSGDETKAREIAEKVMALHVGERL
ncbi:uncharacterized protein LOC141670507 [Apium graveolens]|uniref:uncharacterized protein LOC141670507 n=1 Tax=Apium graveolens TaxID=4045 RepID=UPI003D7B9EB7